MKPGTKDTLWELFPLIIILLLGSGIIVGILLPKNSECSYGTEEMMVREKDGRARIVCGCKR